MVSVKLYFKKFEFLSNSIKEKTKTNKTSVTLCLYFSSWQLNRMNFIRISNFHSFLEKSKYILWPIFLTSITYGLFFFFLNLYNYVECLFKVCRKESHPFKQIFKNVNRIFFLKKDVGTLMAYFEGRSIFFD